jgi:hypothetical protein
MSEPISIADLLLLADDPDCDEDVAKVLRDCAREIAQLRHGLQHVASSGCPYETCAALARSFLEFR